MSSWSPKQVGLAGVYSGILTNQPISGEFQSNALNRLNGILKLKLSAVTQMGTITPKLQTAINGDWVDVKSGSAITVAGSSYIRWNIEVAADQTVLPLLGKCRVVISQTNAGDSITVESCDFLI